MDGDGWWSALWTVVVVVARGDAADSPDADAGSANNPSRPTARARARRIEHVNSAAADNGKRPPAVGSSRLVSSLMRTRHRAASSTRSPRRRHGPLLAHVAGAVKLDGHLFKSRPRFWPNAKQPTAESPAQYSPRRPVSSPAERVSRFRSIPRFVSREMPGEIPVDSGPLRPPRGRDRVVPDAGSLVEAFCSASVSPGRSPSRVSTCKTVSSGQLRHE
ncbi:hypothetical protein ABZP36_018653 [Zizania latifolia]